VVNMMAGEVGRDSDGDRSVEGVLSRGECEEDKTIDSPRD